MTDLGIIIQSVIQKIVDSVVFIGKIYAPIDDYIGSHMYILLPIVILTGVIDFYITYKCSKDEAEIDDPYLKVHKKLGLKQLNIIKILILAFFALQCLRTSVYRPLYFLIGILIWWHFMFGMLIRYIKKTKIYDNSNKAIPADRKKPRLAK